MANKWRTIKIIRALKKVDCSLNELVAAYGKSDPLAQETEAIRQALTGRYAAILKLDKLRKVDKVSMSITPTLKTSGLV